MGCQPNSSFAINFLPVLYRMKCSPLKVFLILLALYILCHAIGCFTSSTHREGMVGEYAESVASRKTPPATSAPRRPSQGKQTHRDPDPNWIDPLDHPQMNIAGGTYATPVVGQGPDYGPGGERGVRRRDIPPGDEDLYILKSEIVPPVCPACPQAAACPRQKPCPPCPPCARCPDQPFECKKVPNYRMADNPYLPRPVLNDFSQFGM